MATTETPTILANGRFGPVEIVSVRQFTDRRGVARYKLRYRFPGVARVVEVNYVPDSAYAAPVPGEVCELALNAYGWDEAVRGATAADDFVRAVTYFRVLGVASS